MPCSAQKVDTAPRGASSGHCEIARRTRGSIGSWAATAAASRPKCHHQDHQNGHPCPDTELSPMSCEMTLLDLASGAAHLRRDLAPPTKKPCRGLLSRTPRRPAA